MSSHAKVYTKISASDLKSWTLSPWATTISSSCASCEKRGMHLDVHILFWRFMWTRISLDIPPSITYTLLFLIFFECNNISCRFFHTMNLHCFKIILKYDNLKYLQFFITLKYYCKYNENMTLKYYKYHIYFYIHVIHIVSKALNMY